MLPTALAQTHLKRPALSIVGHEQCEHHTVHLPSHVWDVLHCSLWAVAVPTSGTCTSLTV